MGSVLVALLLVAHGAIHLGFVSPAPPATQGGPAWPFDLGRSWLLQPIGVGGSIARLAGAALVVLVLAGYAATALAVLGWLPASMFRPGMVLGSVASLVLLALFFHRWLVLGLVIDVALLVAVLGAGWMPAGAAL